MDLKGKKVTVVGLARSGVAACNLLLEKGARVSVSDCLDSQDIRANVAQLTNKDNIVDIELGRHTEELIAGQDLVVTSPGVPLDSLPIVWARKRDIPVIGEIELASAFCPSPIIAITGTNGKSTVTTLIGEIFKAAGRKYVVCGNIGSPFSAELDGLSSEDTVILEVSSFQLETIDKFRPKVSVILNITGDHLDRHTSFDEYLTAKSRLFSNQEEDDWLVLNKEDPHSPALAAKAKAKVAYFGKSKDLGRENKGFNNNQLAALSVSSIFAIPQEIAIDTSSRFKGLAHRLEQLGQIGEIEFINDSKATNVNSTLWALDAIKKPIILIAGGRDKGSDFTALREKTKEKVRAMVLLGEAKEKIEQAFRGRLKTYQANSLDQATEQAYRLARAGDCILLSPMCASFDMFRDYRERGDVFKKAVQDLVQSSKFKVQSFDA